MSGLLVTWPKCLFFRVLIYPWIWLINFCIVAISTSSFAMRLACSVTYITRFMLASVRLVTDALSSSVACARFAKASLILTRLLAPYLSLRDLFDSLGGRLVILYNGTGRMSSIFCPSYSRPNNLQGTVLSQLLVCRRYGKYGSPRLACFLIWQSLCTH